MFAVARTSVDTTFSQVKGRVFKWRELRLLSTPLASCLINYRKTIPKTIQAFVKSEVNCERLRGFHEFHW